ncbi:OLC1v1021981C1 [Oldenlandia corymbosa var. corymbosa]|nr:OLC1v1021981C1 [Oldenlandia corymbosa var. corymbosa]
MEKRFKIWVYKEGDQSPLFHQSAVNLAYAIEGQFIDELENGNRKFLAKHPDEAVTFFLPIGVTYTIMFLNKPGNYDHNLIPTVLMDYINVVSNKYEYWNRSNGFDHFFVGCHDWSPDVSADKSKLFKNLIRVICNANTTEGFNPARDATLPEIKIPRKKLGPPLLSQDDDPNNRTILAFFAGGAHGYVRNRLHQYWKDKDDDIRVYQYLPKSINYMEMMRQSKFCLCASGYEVATPRVTESIYAGCVPVLISDGFVPPYSDVLDWSQFSVQIPVARIPEIKSILGGISMEEYLRLQKNVFQVQRHFILHRPAQPFDMFHMILHSIWLRRLNVRLATT